MVSSALCMVLPLTAEMGLPLTERWFYHYIIEHGFTHSLLTWFTIKLRAWLYSYLRALFCHDRKHSFTINHGLPSTRNIVLKLTRRAWLYRSLRAGGFVMTFSLILLLT